MRRLPIALAAVLTAAAWLAPAASAQMPLPSVLDKEIEAAEKRLNELKQQKKRDELQRQIRALQAELDGMGGGAATAPERPVSESGGGASAASPAPRAVDAAVPSDAGRPAARAAGGEAAGGAAGAQQADNKCLQAATGAVALNRFDQAICDLALAIVETGVRLQPDQQEGLLVPLLAGQLAKSGGTGASLIDAAVADFVIEAEPKRTDKQIGADEKSSGTTSLAVKGGIPSVLGWATEHGAAVASRDGTAVTFRFNPVGIIEALSGEGYISGYRQTENDPLASFFRNTSVGVTFDITRGTDPPTLIGSKQQVSAVSFRYQFVNKRDPRHRDYRDAWARFLRGPAIFFTTAASDALDQLEDPGSDELKFRNAALQKWVEDTVAAVAAKQSDLAGKSPDVQREEVRKVLEQRLASLPADELAQDPAVVGALNNYVASLVSYTAKKNELLEEINKGTVISFEYTNHREVNAPDLSNFRFIAERGTVGGLDFTANASLTIFNKRPAAADARRVKDFSFSAQLDKRLKDTMGLGDSMLSFTGKYERALSDAVALDGTVLPGTKGDIAAGQVKLTIPLGQTGIKLPISVTFANRTELVREREVRGNFGFTLDFDSLFARFKPF
ncbi:MAG TPA: hypothetical protein VF297_10195 [Pyrinomonadaceae bacterium]